MQMLRINPIGISTHLESLSQTDATRQLNLMQQAGVYWVRLEFKWNLIEPASGTWNFSVYDFLIPAILSRGMKIIGLLDQYNVPSWYGTPSNQPPVPTDYAAWIQVVAIRYKGQILLYEIGNEPNQNTFWYPQVNAAAYTALLQAVYPALKTIDTTIQVISAGLSPIGPTIFLTNMYAAGAQGYMDYVGYHPYSWPNGPDYTGVGAAFSLLANIQSIMANNGDGNKQIMATEVGWPTYSGGVNEAQQATYIQRVYQKILYEDYQYVAIACIYDFVDDGTDATNPEDNFGLLHTDYSQKPSYTIMQTVASNYNANFLNTTQGGGTPLFVPRISLADIQELSQAEPLERIGPATINAVVKGMMRA